MVSISWSNEAGAYSLVGLISETFDASALSVALEKGPVRADLSGVSRVNSPGVREWVRFVRTVPQAKLTLLNVPFSMSQQASMIRGFFDGCVIESIAVPFFCDNCELAMEVVMLESQFGDREPTGPACERCGGQTVLDTPGEGFFDFMKGRR